MTIATHALCRVPMHGGAASLHGSPALPAAEDPLTLTLSPGVPRERGPESRPHTTAVPACQAPVPLAGIASAAMPACLLTTARSSAIAASDAEPVAARRVVITPPPPAAALAP